MVKLTCEICGVNIESPDYEPDEGDVVLCTNCFKKSPLARMPHSSVKHFDHEGHRR